MVQCLRQFLINGKPMEFLEKLRRGISEGWKRFVDFWIDESDDDE